ncbi:mechanosensitive ion channel family protein [Geotalea toluenoxydans]
MSRLRNSAMSVLHITVVAIFFVASGICPPVCAGGSSTVTPTPAGNPVAGIPVSLQDSNTIFTLLLGVTLFSYSLIIAAIIAGLLLYVLIFHFLHRAEKYGWILSDPRMVDRLAAPARIMLPLLCVIIISPYLLFQEQITAFLQHLFEISLIVACTWLLMSLVLGLQDVILSRYDLMVHDNLKARVVHTQVNVLVKIVLVVFLILAFALALTTFEQIRRIGISILASAGIIGVIAGIGAQRSIAHIFAGIQIALSQPIRIDDVVIVEGEWGVIEEITLTYVVVRIWDLRHLVVPITYFLEKPFQNWTRATAHLLGTVMIYADYTVPVEELRSELKRILDHAPKWNGEAWALHVTDAKERSLELRALVSADNAGNLWELRCHVREKLVEFMTKSHPESLPRFRADLGS